MLLLLILLLLFELRWICVLPVVVDRRLPYPGMHIASTCS